MQDARDRAIEPRAFSFIRLNEREHKPRAHGITEIRGPYYTPLGRHMLEDIFETVGEYVDALKFAGGSFTLMPRRALIEIIDRCHQSDVLVSTGGFIERVLSQGPDVVDRYVGECRDCGFDIIEISSGFFTLPADDWLRLIDRVQKSGLKVKPEVGIQFGAGGATQADELEAAGTRDVAWPIHLARRFPTLGRT
jgi:phosphosulfolactate synthase (CoM biosynthesis protein A)